LMSLIIATMDALRAVKTSSSLTNTTMGELGLAVALECVLIRLRRERKRVEDASRDDGSWNGFHSERCGTAGKRSDA
jgi:hypothetical protein